MSDQLPKPSEESPTLDYSSKAPADKPPFSVWRVLLLFCLVILGIGALIFGICTVVLIYHH